MAWETFGFLFRRARDAARRFKLLKPLTLYFRL